jgi:hypothetical protein
MLCFPEPFCVFLSEMQVVCSSTGERPLAVRTLLYALVAIR